MDEIDKEDELFQFHGTSFLIPQHVMTVIRKKKTKPEFDYAVMGFHYIEQQYFRDGRFDVESLSCVSEDVELFLALSLLAVSHGINRWPLDAEKQPKDQFH